MNVGLLKNKSVKNMLWIVVSKIIQSFLTIIISMLTARYLGPSNFGIINYVASIVTFVVPIMQLGFNNVLVHEIANHPEEEGKIIGTILVLSAISAIFCIVCCISFCLIVNFNEPVTIIVCALYSSILLFQSADLIQYWFQAKLLSKWTSIATFVAYFIVAVYKFFILFTGKNIYFFALSNSLDYLLIAILLFIMYKKNNGQKLRFSYEVGKRVLNSSKHYIIPGLMVAIYGQTDKIMIKLMIDNEAAGYYSAAVACANMTGFVFTAIIDSIRPIIFEAKKEGNIDKYKSRISLLYNLIIYLSLIQSITITIFSRFIINILYGEEFAPASIPLMIICWYVAFSYFGSIRDIWMLAESKQKYLWIIYISGAVINVGLNFALIPIWGIAGAAIASLITQFFCNFILGFIMPPIRENNFLLLKGLNPKVFFGVLRKKENEQN